VAVGAFVGVAVGAFAGVAVARVDAVPTDGASTVDCVAASTLQALHPINNMMIVASASVDTRVRTSDWYTLLPS